MSSAIHDHFGHGDASHPTAAWAMAPRYLVDHFFIKGRFRPEALGIGFQAMPSSRLMRCRLTAKRYPDARILPSNTQRESLFGVVLAVSVWMPTPIRPRPHMQRSVVRLLASGTGSAPSTSIDTSMKSPGGTIAEMSDIYAVSRRFCRRRDARSQFPSLLGKELRERLLFLIIWPISIT